MLNILKIFLALILDIDLSKFSLVNGSPSSNNNSLLITASLVTLFPSTFILSTKTFSPSVILNLIAIFSNISSTLCSDKLILL